MSIEDTFFEDLVREIQKVNAKRPRGEFDKGWNFAVKTCIQKIYHFFGRGNPPGEVFQSETEEQTADDPVNHPGHYTSGRILGSAMKYICRAGKKDPAKTAEDMRKAVWYLERYISQIA